jgi:hypothetical protein
MPHEEMAQSQHANLRVLQSSHGNDSHAQGYRQYEVASGQISLVSRVLERSQPQRYSIKLSTLAVPHARRVGNLQVALMASKPGVSQEMQYFLDLSSHLHISYPFLIFPDYIIISAYFN